ncbi:hypothetical protein HYPDE_24598 [Hyphomicrobium denitrificans 1NES1]|uniref:Uncharacterized protein n=2 Tax=Hyphomicrobium denitrificans TaxID=53399 RepID=N0B975_9HYPH|nr:hypothetical protein HYPDE_24598 [Hyphomicrobium denitrificans 1NES1]
MIYGATLMVLALASAAVADTTDNAGGRFTMSPVDGGFLRLDRQTGAVAMCARSGTTWACAPVEDHTPTAAAAEVSKLEQENKDLKDRVKALEETLETKTPLDGPPGGKMQLPTDQEVDQALDYLERVYKKVRDRMKDLDKPLPPPDAPPPPKGSL